jgi:hypothetical protein
MRDVRVERVITSIRLVKKYLLIVENRARKCSAKAERKFKYSVCSNVCAKSNKEFIAEVTIVSLTGILS